MEATSRLINFFPRLVQPLRSFTKRKKAFHGACVPVDALRESIGTIWSGPRDGRLIVVSGVPPRREHPLTALQSLTDPDARLIRGAARDGLDFIRCPNIIVGSVDMRGEGRGRGEGGAPNYKLPTCWRTGPPRKAGEDDDLHSENYAPMNYCTNYRQL